MFIKIAKGGIFMVDLINLALVAVRINNKIIETERMVGKYYA